MSVLLKVEDLHVQYKAVPALAGVGLTVNEGEVRIILGSNGAGKTTIVKSIMGLLKPARGSIRLGDVELLALKPHQIHALGISWVPEGRQLWGTLSVMDNLRMGGFLESDEALVRERIEQMFVRFPRLGERRHQLADSLSGGEQQMVAIARALVSRPKLLLMDEPSLGLAPLVVKDVFALVREINQAGVAILMVEQNARQALKVADWAYLLDVGRMIESGPAAEIASRGAVQEIFLGGRA